MSRIYYKNAKTGDRGYLARVGERIVIRVMVEGVEVDRPYRQDAWIAEYEHRPLTPMAMALVTFEADKALCFALGLHQEARRTWLNTHERDRIRWMEDGPGQDAHPRRRHLHAAILQHLRSMDAEDAA